MTASINGASLASYTPSQLSSELLREFTDVLPRGSSSTVSWGSDSSKAAAGSPAVIVSLSGVASAALNQLEIALEVINKGSGKLLPQTPNPVASAPSALASGTPSPAPAASGDALLQQYLSLPVADRFYATTTLSEITAGLSADQKAAFEAAYQSKTLRIQNAADVPGLDYHETWNIGPWGESGGGSFSGAVNQQYGQNYLVTSTLYGGGIFVSWGSPSTGNNAASPAPESTTTSGG
jgi:hypothetical protein